MKHLIYLVFVVSVVEISANFGDAKSLEEAQMEVQTEVKAWTPTFFEIYGHVYWDILRNNAKEHVE